MATKPVFPVMQAELLYTCRGTPSEAQSEALVCFDTEKLDREHRLQMPHPPIAFHQSPPFSPGTRHTFHLMTDYRSMDGVLQITVPVAVSTGGHMLCRTFSKMGEILSGENGWSVT